MAEDAMTGEGTPDSVTELREQLQAAPAPVTELRDQILQAVRNRELELRLQAGRAYSDNHTPGMQQVAPFVEFLAGEMGALGREIAALTGAPKPEPGYPVDIEEREDHGTDGSPA